jgi:hypothetical protein
MKRLTVIAAASFALLATLTGGRADAQVIGIPYVPPATSPIFRPPLSPYLNLARPGNPGINYYGLVQPQLQATAAINQLQTQYTTLNQQLVAGQAVGTVGYPLVSGHSAGFLNHYGYFQNWRTRTGVLAGYPGTVAGYPGTTAGYPGTNFGMAGSNVGFGVLATGNNLTTPSSRSTVGPRPPNR